MSRVIYHVRNFASRYDNLITKHPLRTKCATAAALAVIGDGIAQYVSYYRSTKKDSEFKLDKQRSLTFFLVGGFCAAPLFHFWYNWLDQLPRQAAKYKPFKNIGKWGTLGLKLAFDQIVFSPVFLVVFYVSCSSVTDMICKAENSFARYKISQSIADDNGSHKSELESEICSLRNMNDQELAWSHIVCKALSETRRLFLYSYIADTIFWPPLQAINFTLVPLRYQVLYLNSASLVWNTFLSTMANSEDENKK